MQPTQFEPMTEPIEQMIGKINVQSVFGAPIEQPGVTIIPVAQLAYGFGYGGGYGRNNGDDEQPPAGATPAAPAVAAGAPAEGGGIGGGAGGRATPCGYIRITAEGVAYEPIADNTRIPLAGILFAAWAVFWVMATIRTITKAVAKTRQAKHKG